MKNASIEVPLGDTSPASASTVVGLAAGGFSKWDQIAFVATITGATGGTLDVYVQHSPDGVTWYDYVHFTQAAGGAAAVTYFYSPAVSSGTTTAPVVIGKNTTPALANSTATGGPWYDQLRVLYVAGASTTAGAAQTINVLCAQPEHP